MTSVDIVGSGMFGTTLAILLANKGVQVRLICRRRELTESIIAKNENSLHLPGIRIPDNVKPIFLSDADFSESSNVILVVTSQHMRELLSNPVFRTLKPGARILHASKGLEHYYKGKLSGERMSQVISEALFRPIHEIAVLSGPNIASEMAAGNYAETVIACRDEKIANEWKNIFFSPGIFNPKTSDDVAGVELGGALKNVVAIACGIADGLGIGENAKAAIIHKGLREMIAIGMQHGAKKDTFFGLSGLFDLDVTCHSKFGRNRLIGELLARGIPLETALEQLIAEKRGEPEGPEMAKVMFELTGDLDLPVLKLVFDVVNGAPAESCVKVLFGK